MKGVPDDTPMGEPLPPLPALLTAYAPAEARGWQRLCWLLDQRLAAVVRRGGEPTIAAIRLAWWHEVLVEGDMSKGGGEPLVEAWRRIGPVDAPPLAERLIDGWRTLLSPEAMSTEDLADYAQKRGGGLFGLIAGEQGEAEALVPAGALWALWDLAGHAGDAALASSAMAQARIFLDSGPALPRRAPKPLRLLHHVVAGDVRAARAPRGFEGRHYRRLLWGALTR